MPFPEPERATLLAIKGVGPGVVSRLEQLGIDSLATLARQDAAAICAEVSARLGTTCWRNAPKARQAVAAAIEAARAASRA
jgi:predicted flap endonuclease-1-like 5' DNA nuclease